MDYETVKQMGGVLKGVEFSLGYQKFVWAINEAADADAVVNACYEYTRQKVDSLLPAATEIQETFVPSEATSDDSPAADSSGTVHVVRAVLTHEGENKYRLELYPEIKGKPGQWPELKYVSDKDRMWEMLESVWQEGWKLPVDKEVNWAAQWVRGREKVKGKGHYKDLVAINPL